MAGATRWIRPRDDALVWETIGEANFVYHPASGQTHYLNQLGAWLLTALESRAHTAAELIAALLAAHAAEPSAELDDAVAGTLRVLHGLGLILTQPETP